MKDNKNKPVLKSPLVMLVDPTMQNERMSIKVLSLENTRPLAVFAEVPFSFQVKDFERSGLDVVFYGQDHYDTMAILQQRDNITQDELGTLMKEQKLFTNKEMMLRNFKEVTDNLTDCEKYI
jgi:hypothetical protein